jgi:hypothetical protein
MYLIRASVLPTPGIVVLQSWSPHASPIIALAKHQNFLVSASHRSLSVWLRADDQASAWRAVKTIASPVARALRQCEIVCTGCRSVPNDYLQGMIAIVATNAGVVFPGLIVPGNETMECVHAISLESGALLWSLPIDLDVTSMIHFHKNLIVGGGPSDRIEIWDIWARRRVRVLNSDEGKGEGDDTALHKYRAARRVSATSWHTQSSTITRMYLAAGPAGLVLLTGSSEGQVAALHFDG